MTRPEQADRADEDNDQPPVVAPEEVRKGRRRRRKLSGLLEEDEAITGSVEMMMRDPHRVFPNRMVLRGAHLTVKGGPAREVIRLVKELVESVEAAMPGADAHLASVVGGNSIEVKMYAPEHELRAAEVRREYLGEDAGFDALPNTTIAVAAVASILGRDDPEEVAKAARRVSKATAEEIRELTVTLANNEVELDLSDIRPETGVQPPKARAIVERVSRRRVGSAAADGDGARLPARRELSWRRNVRNRDGP
jgi:hypothetical protein